jgi:hypothetical protein
MIQFLVALKRSVLKVSWVDVVRALQRISPHGSQIFVGLPLAASLIVQKKLMNSGHILFIVSIISWVDVVRASQRISPHGSQIFVGLPLTASLIVQKKLMSSGHILFIVSVIFDRFGGGGMAYFDFHKASPVALPLSEYQRMVANYFPP